MSWTPPYPTNEMLALQASRWSGAQIAVRYKMTRNAVIGRLTRARARLAGETARAPEESAPSALSGTSPALWSDEVASGLVAGNSGDRGAHLDSLIWKRSSYLKSLREEGGL